MYWNIILLSFILQRFFSPFNFGASTDNKSALSSWHHQLPNTAHAQLYFIYERSEYDVRDKHGRTLSKWVWNATVVLATCINGFAIYTCLHFKFNIAKSTSQNIFKKKIRFLKIYGENRPNESVNFFEKIASVFKILYILCFDCKKLIEKRKLHRFIIKAPNTTRL